MILVDSDIIVDLIRNFPPAVNWFKSVSKSEEIFVPGFVVMEMIQGCKNKEEQDRVQKLLMGYSVVWLPPDECNLALENFSTYWLSHNIGLVDILIGQTAIALKTRLFTFNQKHYSIIPNLETIQPYKK